MAPVVVDQSARAWKVGLLTIDAFALFMSAFRLFMRHKRNNLWWDDVFVLIPTASMIATVVFYENGMSVFAPLDPTNVNNFWKSSFVLLSTVWWARIALAVGLIRVFPSRGRPRHVAPFLAVTFFVLWLILITVYPTSCDASANWTVINYADCTGMSRSPSGFTTLLAPTLSLIFEHIGNTLLLLCPFYMVWALKLPQSDRGFIIAMLASSTVVFVLIISMTVVYNAPFEYTVSRGILAGGFTHLECAFVMLFCNMVPMAACAYRTYCVPHIPQTLVYLSASGTTMVQKASPGGLGGCGARGNNSGIDPSAVPSGPINTTVTKSIAVKVDDTNAHHLSLEKSKYGLPEANDSGSFIVADPLGGSDLETKRKIAKAC